MKRLLMLMILAACGPDDEPAPKDRDDDPETTCDPEASPSLVIGQGQGTSFSPLEDGDMVTLDVAPQGGYGVSIRAKTTGLVTEDLGGTIDVLLETELDGTQAGSFLNQGTNLYCQADGTGLLWGVVVGFDSDTFPDPDALIALDGEEVTLIVGAEDAHGDNAQGEVVVIVEVGG